MVGKNEMQEREGWCGQVPSCSRNARPQQALVGRAQLRATLATPFDAEKDGRRKEESWPGNSLCSRNARSQTPLVGRAHVGNRPGSS